MSLLTVIQACFGLRVSSGLHRRTKMDTRPGTALKRVGKSSTLPTGVRSPQCFDPTPAELETRLSIALHRVRG
jgi:hypothetical protein